MYIQNFPRNFATNTMLSIHFTERYKNRVYHKIIQNLSTFLNSSQCRHFFNQKYQIQNDKKFGEISRFYVPIRAGESGPSSGPSASRLVCLISSNFPCQTLYIIWYMKCLFKKVNHIWKFQWKFCPLQRCRTTSPSLVVMTMAFGITLAVFFFSIASIFCQGITRWQNFRIRDVFACSSFVALVPQGLCTCAFATRKPFSAALPQMKTEQKCTLNNFHFLRDNLQRNMFTNKKDHGKEEIVFF